MSLPTRVVRGFVDPFENLTREFDVLNRYFNGGQGNGARLAPYGVDIREDGDNLVVEAELPGFKKDEVDITLENQTLTISAEKKEENKRPSRSTIWMIWAATMTSQMLIELLTNGQISKSEY